MLSTRGGYGGREESDRKTAERGTSVRVKERRAFAQSEIILHIAKKREMNSQRARKHRVRGGWLRSEPGREEGGKNDECKRKG